MVLAFLQIKIIRHINFRLNLKSCKFELTQDHKDMDRGFVSVGAVGAFAPTVLRNLMIIYRICTHRSTCKQTLGI